LKAHQPKPKKSKIKPTSKVSSHLWDLLSQVRCYVWKYEEPEWNNEKQQYNWSKPARSPKTSRHRKIRYREEYFDKDVDLWGTFEEAHAAYWNNQDELQGVGFS